MISNLSEIPGDKKQREPITECLGIHKEWYKQAKEMDIDHLAEFCRHILDDYSHDYGTICHAYAACALAAANVGENMPCGGITGFQAGAIMWEFVSRWLHLEDKPLKLLEFENMLYPQYASKFQSISSSTWAWLQDKAKELLHGENESRVHPNVWSHWKSIVAGMVPFGYYVEGE